MKTTVSINSRGVVTLPAELRQALDLNADDHLIAETTPEGALLRPAITLPIEICTAAREREFDAAEADALGTHFGVGYGKTFGGVTVHSPHSLTQHLLLR